ncbi:MAG: hypothetical protein GEU73_15385 [Chloroflexi bacterium]|nr:hypothetical protein [Chloroflexota bacterium]
MEESMRHAQLLGTRAVQGIAALGVAALVATACAPGSATTPTTTPANTAPPAASSPAASPAAQSGPSTVMVRQDASLGSILTDSEGRTLYLFTRDEPNTSNCSGNCLQAWPPLIASGSPSVGSGGDTSLVGTITRDDGTMQVTYNRWPLYYYRTDENPGDTTGQNVGGNWFVLSPQGEAIGM